MSALSRMRTFYQERIYSEATSLLQLLFALPVLTLLIARKLLLHFLALPPSMVVVAVILNSCTEFSILTFIIFHQTLICSRHPRRDSYSHVHMLTTHQTILLIATVAATITISVGKNAPNIGGKSYTILALLNTLLSILNTSAIAAPNIILCPKPPVRAE